MPLDPITIGLLAGLGKDVLIDGPKERAQYEYEAQRALASPWYGMNDQGHMQSKRGDAIMQGLGAGLYSQATQAKGLPGGKTEEELGPTQLGNTAPIQFSPEENQQYLDGMKDTYRDTIIQESPYQPQSGFRLKPELNQRKYSSWG